MLNNLLLRQDVDNFVEDVFSTYLYYGTGATQTLTGGVDFNQGGMVWIKCRNSALDHAVYDTARGATFELSTASSGGQLTQSTGVTSFGSTGATIGSSTKVNTNGYTYAAWSFRKAPKFFDIVTFSGTGVARTINHNLGVVPGMIWVKCTSSTGNWYVYHKDVGASSYLVLDTSNSVVSSTTAWNATSPTATNFSIGSLAGVNASGFNYVAYLFAHDTSENGVVQCGVYTGNGAAPGPTVNLGWEPQFILIKRANTTASASDWFLFDAMRGIYSGASDYYIMPDATNAEGNSNLITLNPTGFQLAASIGAVNRNGDPYIYIAIRRPMKMPTSGSQVLEIVTRTGNSTNNAIVGTSVRADLAIIKNRGGTGGAVWLDRVRGTPYLTPTTTAVEASDTAVNPANPFDMQVGVKVGGGAPTGTTNANSSTYVNYLLSRAAGFLDIVTYTGNGTQGFTFNHNLEVSPSFIIIKQRDTAAQNWYSWNDTQNGTNWWQYYVLFNGTNAMAAYGGLLGLGAAPTSTTVTLGSSSLINGSGVSYIAYLFANRSGVLKVGSYTGNGTTINVDCGFAAGARFVLLRRTSTGGGNWFVFDSVRGITSSTDPYFAMNGTAAEVTSINAVAPLTGGFSVTQEATSTNLNVSAATYIYVAIA